MPADGLRELRYPFGVGHKSVVFSVIGMWHCASLCRKYGVVSRGTGPGAGWCRVVSCRVVSCRVVSCRVVSCRVVGIQPTSTPCRCTVNYVLFTCHRKTGITYLNKKDTDGLESPPDSHGAICQSVAPSAGLNTTQFSRIGTTLRCLFVLILMRPEPDLLGFYTSVQ